MVESSGSNRYSSSSSSSFATSDQPAPLQPTPRRGPPAALTLGAEYPLLAPGLLPLPPPTPSSSVSGSVGHSSTSALLHQHQLDQRGPLTPAPSPGSSSVRRLWEEDGPSDAAGYIDLEGSEGSGSASRGKGKAGRLEDGMRSLWRDTEYSAVQNMDPQTLIAHFETLPPGQRFVFLALLVPALRLNEALVVSRRIEPRLKRDFLRELPGELALHCLSFITEAHTLAHAARVSKYWYSLLQDEQTWKDMCEWHRFTPIATPLRSRTRREEGPSQSTSDGSSSRLLVRSTGGRNPRTAHRQWLRESMAGGLGIRGVDVDTRPDRPGVGPPHGAAAVESGTSENVMTWRNAGPSGSPQRQHQQRQRRLSARRSDDANLSAGENSGSAPDYYVPSSIPLGPHPALRSKGREGFSFKAQFKNSYMTQRNWLTGGRVLREFIAVNEDDGVVTSLAVNEHFMIVGMANARIHVFDAATARYRGTLLGHPLGVWTLTLISPYTGNDDSEDEEDVAPSTYAHPTGGPVSAATAGGRYTGTGAGARHRPGRYRDDGISRRASTGAGVAEWGTPPTDAQMRNGMGEPVRTYLPPSLSTTPDSSAATGRYPSTPLAGPGGWGINRPSTASGASASASALRQDDPFGPGGGSGQGPERGQRREREDRRPRAKKMRSSDICGSARGWSSTGLGAKHLVVSGGCDRMVKVWDVATGACIHTLSGHASTVRCLKVLDRRPIAISGSRDAKLRVWDIQEGTLLRELEGHTGSVRCIEIAGNRVVSGSYDNDARVWDVDTGECLHVLRGHYHQLYACAFDGERIITGSLDSTVRVWDATTGECLALLQGHTSLVGHIQFCGNRLITGGSDGRVIVFDLSTYECLHRLCAHDNSVTCLQYDERYIISGGMDGRVKLWDTRTGTFIRELTRPCTSVWRIGCRDDRVVILCQRGGKTVLEVLTFRPGEMVGKRLAL